MKRIIKEVKSIRNEQIEDNIADPECIATITRPNALGVDYAPYRKLIAAELKDCIVRSGNTFSLTTRGVALFAQVLSTGVKKATVLQWLKKYEGFNSYLFTNFTIN